MDGDEGPEFGVELEDLAPGEVVFVGYLFYLLVREAAVSLNFLLEHTPHRLLLKFLIHDTVLQLRHTLHHFYSLLPLLETHHGLLKFSGAETFFDILVSWRRCFLRIISTALLKMLLLNLVHQLSNILVVLESLSVLLLHLLNQLLLTLELVLLTRSRLTH